MTPARFLLPAVLALAACGADADDDTAGDAPASETIVEIRDFAFTDADLTVDAGSTIVFANADDTAHTATAREGAFDSDSIAAGERATVTVSDPGTYPYYCSFHPFMEASLTVR